MVAGVPTLGFNNPISGVKCDKKNPTHRLECAEYIE